jgi:predicted O-methyltransferase YrrM
MAKPKRVLEIGTYTGYSALCMAEGMPADGVLHTIDINDELETRVRGYFKASAYDEQIKFHLGNALDVIRDLNESWDLVFIDADKENYSNYFDMVIDHVSPGGWIVADNVLWSGKVLDDESAMDHETRALHEYNRKISEDSRVESLLLPVRDGLMCCRKL